MTTTYSLTYSLSFPLTCFMLCSLTCSSSYENKLVSVENNPTKSAIVSTSVVDSLTIFSNQSQSFIYKVFHHNILKHIILFWWFYRLFFICKKHKSAYG